MIGVYEHKVGGHTYFRAMGFVGTSRFILYQGKSKKAAHAARKRWDKDVYPNIKPGKNLLAQFKRLWGG